MPPAILQVDYAQLSAWITAIAWPLVRILALVSTAPVLGDAAVPRRARIVLGLLLAGVIAPGLPPAPAVPMVSVAGAGLVVQQVLIGAAMGLAMRLTFAIVQAAGEYLGLAMGLSFAAFYDPGTGGQTQVLSRLLHALLVLVFLAVDGHLFMLMALAESFHALPVGDALPAPGGWRTLALAGGQLFASGLLLALPLVTAMLAVNLCMGMLNRAAPQLSLFSIGFPLTLLAGLGLLLVQLPAMSPWLQALVAKALALMEAVVLGLR